MKPISNVDWTYVLEVGAFDVPCSEKVVGLDECPAAVAVDG